MNSHLSPQQITPIVGAIAAYTNCTRSIQPDLLRATLEQDQVLSAGARAKPLVADHLAHLGDAKASSALQNLESDPSDEDYRSKLVRELVRLAQSHPDFAQELRRIADTLPDTATRSGVNIANYASNQGFQGTSYGPITIDNRKRSE
jgi:hypothetical protein